MGRDDLGSMDDEHTCFCKNVEDSGIMTRARALKGACMIADSQSVCSTRWLTGLASLLCLCGSIIDTIPHGT